MGKKLLSKKVPGTQTAKMDSDQTKPSNNEKDNLPQLQMENQIIQ